MIFNGMRLLFKILLVSVLVACSAPESQPDLTLIPTQNPTKIPESTNTPEPTRTPLPTETPEPTATTELVLQPDLEATFDMETCTQEPYGGKSSIVSFSSEVIPEGGHLVALAGKLNKEFYNQTQVPAGFDIDPILYGAWSHLSQQIRAPVDVNGYPIPLEVNIGPTGQEFVYQICLDPSSYGANPPGISLMTPDIIPQTIIQGHCENENGVNKIRPEFMLFDRDLRQNNDPSVTVTINESTTVSEFLNVHEAAECYSIHRESSSLNVFNDPGWRSNYDKATEAQMVAASFINQGATPLPLQFEEGGIPTRMMNPNLPGNAIIPEGDYIFYPKQELPCSIEPFTMNPPIEDENSCYHVFGQILNDGTREWTHSGIDYYAPNAGTPVMSAAQGTVMYAGDLGDLGGRVTIYHGCFTTPEGKRLDYATAYNHSDVAPGIAPGVEVSTGDTIAIINNFEVELVTFALPAGTIMFDDSTPDKLMPWSIDKNAIDPAPYLTTGEPRCRIPSPYGN